mgnify:FL=1
MAVAVVQPMVLLDIVKNSQVHLDKEVSLPLNGFTFCLQFYLEGLEEHWILFKEEKENLGFYLNTQGKVSWVFVSNKNLVFVLPPDAIQPYEWIDFCFTTNATTYAVYLNDGSPIWGTKTSFENQSSLKVQRLVFGIQFYWEFETNLKGLKITNLRFWSSDQTSSSLGDWWPQRTNQCRRQKANSLLPSSTSVGNFLLNWTDLRTQDFSLFRGPLNLIQDFPSIEDICLPTVLDYYPQPLPYHGANQVCQILGGFMFLPQTASDLALFKELNQIHYYWIPIYWQKGKWLELESRSKPATFLPWWPGEPNGRENEPCVCLSMHQQAFHDASCTREFYFVCQFRGPPKKFILRGFMDSRIDFQYILRLDLRFNGQFVFQGLSHSHLMLFDNTTHSWVIYNGTMIPNATFNWQKNVLATTTFQKDDKASVLLPIGKKSWKIFDGLEPLEIFLKFTQCNQQNEFTCYNGQCIDFENFCDDIFDCLDGSDEKHCKSLLIDESTYKPNLPPKKRYEKTDLEIHMDLLIISQIEAINMKFASKLQLSVQWNDSRITYLHLKQSGNNLDDNYANQIWIPNLTFFNSEHSSDTVSEKEKIHLEVLRKGQPVGADHTSLEEEKFYSGVDNSLLFKGLYDHSFECIYDLSSYPFDTQLCSVVIDVGLEHRQDLALSGHCQYSGPKQFSEFHVGSVQMIYNDNGSRIACQFELSRDSFKHVTMTYIPTLFISILSLMSLFIHEKHFGNTIMISLTCMLVLYTLYQSIEGVMPVTTYMKLLDYWLVFNLAMPFCTFMTIVSWEYMRQDEDLTNKVMDFIEYNKHMEAFSKKAKLKRHCKLTLQIILPLISFLFLMGYSIVVLFKMQ